MIELVFVAITVALLGGAVVVLVVQHRRSRAESTDPLVGVSRRARLAQVGFFLVWFAFAAVSAARDGREVAAVVATIAVVVAAAHLAVVVRSGVRGGPSGSVAIADK